MFVLAQLQREMGDSEAAIETFGEVASMKVLYELSFKLVYSPSNDLRQKGGSRKLLLRCWKKC